MNPVRKDFVEAPDTFFLVESANGRWGEFPFPSFFFFLLFSFFSHYIGYRKVVIGRMKRKSRYVDGINVIAIVPQQKDGSESRLLLYAGLRYPRQPRQRTHANYRTRTTSKEE